MISANQLVAHLVGDYVLQSDWMASTKTKKSIACLAHILTYSIPFLFFQPSMLALAVIAGSHFIIDRWRLARYVVWAKNWMGPNQPWKECKATGYPPNCPAWMAVWLMILVDNILHVVINGLALHYL
jgi:chromate transport protein ChrA